MADPIFLAFHDQEAYKQKFSETAVAVKKYCNPDIAEGLNNNLFIVFDDKRVKEGVAATAESFSLYDELKTSNNKNPKDAGENKQKKYYRNIINFAEGFLQDPLIKRTQNLCHELSHHNWCEKNGNKMNSKEEERFAYLNGLDSTINFRKDPENGFLPLTKRIIAQEKADIDELLNESPEYKCLPEYEPKTQEEYNTAAINYSACIKGMEQNK